ncbi:MAG: ATPase [bacterium]
MPEASKRNVKTIVVAGDVTIDWNIARARAHLGELTTYQYIWGSDIATRACSQAGGAALLTELLGALCEITPSPSDYENGSIKYGSSKYGYSPPEYEIIGPTIPPEALNNPAHNQYTRSYSIWSAYPRSTGEKGKGMVWRVAEFWGTDSASRTYPISAESPKNAWGVVLDDANLGIRDQQETWPESIKCPSAETEWVVIKIAHPVAKGPVWEQVITHFADKLVAVVSVSDLRRASMHIGYALSWEQISSEVIQAVTNDPNLSKPSAVAVLLGTTGAVIIDRKKGNTLIFDPYAQEENWRRDHPGTCIGYASCSIAALVHQFMKNSGRPDLEDALKRGVNAARAIHLAGYAQGDGNTLVDLRFPVKAVTEALTAEKTPFSSVKLQDLKKREWSILSLRQNLDMKKMAADIVRAGPEESLGDIPLERIGKWSSVDRTEIENIRSLCTIMTEYVAQSRPLRPLSIAVFGPPGSGKSFAIKQVAKGLMPGRLTPLEFNLSQFESHQELPFAFQSVRDCVLRHELPLVFWDEFDTPLSGSELGWLRYFLVPMQDGEFHNGGIPHPLGPAIFVFAGGTHSTMESFRETAQLNPAAKGRDFLSRLRGFLNVLGPNPQGEQDEGFIIRRALLLRSLLSTKAGQLFDRGNVLHIDEGVLQAFLLIDSYRHGARSMECIIDMSSLFGRLMFERSCLPASHQLDLHVDNEKFLNLVSGTCQGREIDRTELR